MKIKNIDNNTILREKRFGGIPDSAKELIFVGQITEGNIYTNNNVLNLVFSESGIETLDLHPYIYPEYDDEQLSICRSLLKLPDFQWWYDFSELFIIENDYEVIDIIRGWARHCFTDEIIDNTTAEERTEAMMWARKIVEEYYL